MQWKAKEEASQLRGKGKEEGEREKFISFTVHDDDVPWRLSFVNIVHTKKLNKKKRERGKNYGLMTRWMKSIIIFSLSFCMCSVCMATEFFIFPRIVQKFHCKTSSTQKRRQLIRAHPLIIFWPHQPHECAIKLHVQQLNEVVEYI
jgi:hypothetical protein